MALEDTGKAIGAVTELLRDRLKIRTGLDVTVGRPSVRDESVDRLNLFLYEAQFDPGLKNIPLDEGQQPPLWLVLKYLLTAFDLTGESDTIASHRHLGEGIRVLQELNFISLTSSTFDALGNNPEILKITFDNITPDLLSKLMQGPDEKYRFSVGFEVKPVMIALRATTSYPLLVGVDYTAIPGNVIGEKGIQTSVIPSLGPTINHISPPKFEVDSTLTIVGKKLDLSGLSVRIGQAELVVSSQQPNRLQCAANGAIKSGNVISAGIHPVTVVHTLPTGRRRSSNILSGHLLPTLVDAVPNSVTHVSSDPASDVFGNIEMTGFLLGRKTDDIFVALYREGKVIKMFDKFIETPGQSTLTLEIQDSQTVPPQTVPPGKYRVILRVNGQQARNSPEVDLS